MSAPTKLISSNKKAYHEYQLLEKFEAGIELKGTEVKSLRVRAASLTDAYVALDRGELFLIGCHIPPYEQGNINNHEPRRRRRLLMHKREIRRLDTKTKEKGLTIVPTRLYFKKGVAKVEIALARGKREHDKRSDMAARDADREIQRAIRGRQRGGD